MAATWRTVRVFLSSTFRDMHAERDHLVKVVFPALRERLEKYRVYLLDVDLRWGVTREQAENDQVLDLCLQQIDECRPFFLGILGERYGWVPTRYAADAVKKFGWIQRHTGKSVTELEILHGVLQNPQMRGRAFFYFRDSNALQAVPEAVRRAVYSETDPGRIAKLVELKRAIRYSGYPVMENYSARWDSEAYDRPSKSKGRLVGLEEFGERVREQLWQALRAELQLPETPPVEVAADPLAEEQDDHERFMESRLRVYVGRQRINDYLLSFAEDDDAVPCLVTGPAGSGKSAALARFVRDYRRRHPRMLVVPHFVGASPRSTGLRQMLRRFCQVLKDHFGWAEEVPEETARLIVGFRDFLGRVPASERVLFVIDALNQLDEAERAQQLEWLPAALPPHAKVVVSCITEANKPEPVLEAFRLRKYCSLEIDPLDDAERREIIRQVPSLSAKTLDDEQINLLLANPATANPLFLLVALEELRGFGSYEQLNERMAGFPRSGDAITALFIQVIERLEQEFDAEVVRSTLTLLASARRGLSQRELQELLAPASSVAKGVGSEETTDGLFPVLRQLRPYLLSRAGLIDFYHRNLFKAVRQRYLDAPERQVAAHAQLAEYFDKQDYWLESLDEQRRRARTLPPTTRPANQRKVDELPWQRLHARQGTELLAVFADLSFWEAKAEAGMVFHLAEDVATSLKRFKADHPEVKRLRLLEGALRRDLHFIARHPTTLFQCLWNSGWWSDCEAAAHFYDIPEGGWPPDGPPWQRRGAKLSRLLEQWRRAKEESLPEFRWLRTLRPPAHSLGALQAVFTGHEGPICTVSFSADGQRLVSGGDDKTVRVWDVASSAPLQVFEGHTSYVTSAAMSPDGRRLASASFDETVRIWDAGTGAELVRLGWPHKGVLTTVCWFHDSKHIATGAVYGFVRFWDTRTGIARGSLGGPSHGAVAGLGLAPSGKRLAVGSMDATTVWDVASRQVLGKLEPAGKEVSSGERERADPRPVDLGGIEVTEEEPALTEEELVPYFRFHNEERCKNNEPAVFSPDGRFLATTEQDAIHIWDAQTLALVRRLEGHRNKVTSLAFFPDGRLVSGSADYCLRLWDTTTGQTVKVFRTEDSPIAAVACSPEGRLIASGNAAGLVQLWDASYTDQPMTLRCSGERFEQLDISPDGTRLLTRGREGTLRLWNFQTGLMEGEFPKEAGAVRLRQFSPCGRRLALADADQKLLVFDTDSCRRVAELTGAGASGVAFSPDCRRIASHGSDGLVSIRDLEGGKRQARLQGDTSLIDRITFSPDGRLLASVCLDGGLRIWDAQDGTCIASFESGGMAMKCVAFSHDSRWVATGGGDGFVRLWSAEQLKEVDRVVNLGAIDEVSFLRQDLKIAYHITLEGEKSDAGELSLVWILGEENRLWVPRAIHGGEDATCLLRANPHHRLQALADGIPAPALILAERPVETALVVNPDNVEVAWFPAVFESTVGNMGGDRWAGTSANHLQILQIEGAKVEPTGSRDPTPGFETGSPEEIASRGIVIDDLGFPTSPGDDVDLELVAAETLEEEPNPHEQPVVSYPDEWVPVYFGAAEVPAQRTRAFADILRDDPHLDEKELHDWLTSQRAGLEEFKIYRSGRLEIVFSEGTREFHISADTAQRLIAL
jgi:WD40 repeat protein